jgi:hypothetical protein
VYEDSRHLQWRKALSYKDLTRVGTRRL